MCIRDRPLYDALQDMIPAAKLKEYMELNIIQIAPLAFMRGRTLNDAVVILDEAQNTTCLLYTSPHYVGTNSHNMREYFPTIYGTNGTNGYTYP